MEKRFAPTVGVKVNEVKNDTKISPVAEETLENNDRKSIDLFLRLEDKILSEIGVPEENIFIKERQNFVWHPVTRNIHIRKHINKILKDREKNNAVDKFKENITNVFRVSGRSDLDSITDDERNFRQFKTSKLKKYKNEAENTFKIWEEAKENKGYIESMRTIELSADKILNKYKKDKITDLFSEDCEINDGDLYYLLILISDAFCYRNRKIKEFVAYRYAMTAPKSDGVEKFIKNVHKIVSPNESSRKEVINKGNYRPGYISNDRNFFAPFPPQMVPSAISYLSTLLEDKQKLKNVENIQKEALKTYILFETIHPFIDGNGRTGRALFVYIQKYLSDKENIGSRPIHMPIDRKETGGDNSGSLDYRIGSEFKNIINAKEVTDLLVEQSGLNEKLYYDLSGARGKITEIEADSLAKANVDKLWKLLDTPNINKKLDELIQNINQLSSLDDVKEQDLNMIYESTRNQLKKSS